MVNKWNIDKEFGKLNSLLSKIGSIYIESKKDTKERGKIIEYVKISTYIHQGLKRMVAYKLASPEEIDNTVEQRYLRQKNN